MPLTLGTKVGPHEITGLLGQGGMGVVYRAKDLRLGREVALKVLRGPSEEVAERTARLEREARILASLNHPNIAQIYGFEISGEIRALIMELVDGPTLDDLIGQRLLTFTECLSIATQIAEALAEAHGKGIVHRDLKPRNIKVAKGGRVKVLDFGLARLQADNGPLIEGSTTITRIGTVLGTVGYMAPEQVRGETVDNRADIFAFGCVLYEMATGEQPFSRSSSIEMLTAVLHDTPLAPSRRRRELPSGLDRVVAHCLEKEPAARFQSAQDLKFALGALAPDEVHIQRERRSASVAVLPFVNLSADPENEFFADGITEDVIAHIAKIKSLKVISRTSVMTFKKRDCGLREIGERLGASTLLEGSVRRAGNRVRITAQLIDSTSDEHIWAETYDRDLTDIFAIQSDVALNIANALRGELSKDERARVGRPPTHNLEAYEVYLRGRSWFNRFTEESLRRSLLEYDAAIARDPKFALAWAGIAEAHSELCIGGSVGQLPEEHIALAKKAAARALEIDEELGEAHAISGLIQFAFEFDWSQAERSFRRAIELSPGSAEVHEHYSWLCSAVERYDDALREVRCAREFDPLLIQTDVANTLLRAGRIEEALEEARRSARELPGTPRVHSTLGWALIFRGETRAGIASLEEAVALSPGATMFLSQLGQAYALAGDVERARQILQQLQDRAEREFVSPYHLAYVHAGLGEADAAVDQLERAFKRRSGALYGIKGSFLFKNLRNHPRFVSLLRRMNLS